MAQKKLGNCSTVSLNIFVNYHENFLHDLPPVLKQILGKFGKVKLANGIVFGSNGTGNHVHAWVEDDIFCYDFANGNEAVIPKEQYYQVGKIEKFKLYGMAAVRNKITQTGIDGFWDFPNHI